jgi:hypothetical protein
LHAGMISGTSRTPGAPVRRPCYIYALRDTTGAVVYVGKTFHPRRRARQHHGYWLGLVTFHILDVVPPGENFWESEAWWVRHMEGEGAPLLNVYLRERGHRGSVTSKR